MTPFMIVNYTYKLVQELGLLLLEEKNKPTTKHEPDTPLWIIPSCHDFGGLDIFELLIKVQAHEDNNFNLPF